MPSRALKPKLARGVGKRFRSLREETGTTLEKVAAYSDLSKSTLSRIEGGKHGPSLGTVFDVAEVLGVLAADLLAIDTAAPRMRLLDAARRGDASGVLAALRDLGFEFAVVDGDVTLRGPKPSK